MKSYEELFLAVCEHPHDETLRLVLADWLDDQGDPRGEYIRVQIALAGLPHSDPRRSPLAVREQELRSEHGRSWLPPEVPHVKWDGFEKGFIEQVAISRWSTIVEHAERIRELAPIRHLRFHNCPVPMSQLEGLLESPLGRQLTGLSLDDCRLDDRAAIRLIENASVGRLVRLDLNRNGLRDAAVRAIAASPNVAKLAWLDLSYNGFGDSGTEWIAMSEHLRRLETLALNHNNIRGEGAVALAQNTQLSALAHLYLSVNRIGDYGAKAFADSAARSRLETLELSFNQITDDGALALAASPHLAQLSQLHLSLNTLSPAACDRLRERFGDGVEL